MNNDEMVAISIKPGHRSGHCIFKIHEKLGWGKVKLHCKNPMNVNGACDRRYCPLANGQYGTVRSEDGKLYLSLKTVERAHLPSRLWNRIELSKNKEKAFEQIDDEMIGEYREYYIEACKAKYAVEQQILKRARMLQIREMEKVKVNKENKKSIKREKSREEAALRASRLNLNIEKELVERLTSGLYGDLYDVGEQRLSDEWSDAEEEEDSEAQADAMAEKQDIEDIGKDPLLRNKVTFTAEVSESTSDDSEDVETIKPRRKKTLNNVLI